jgi:hypothetical protein
VKGECRLCDLSFSVLTHLWLQQKTEQMDALGEPNLRFVLISHY